MQARRLLLCIYYLAPAGMEVQCMHLARGLAERGHEVTIACFVVGHAVDPLQRAGVRILRLPHPRGASRARAIPVLARIARDHDLVHCTGWDATLWGRLAAVAARRPVVVTEHTPGRHTQASRSGSRRARAIGWHNRLLEPFTAATVAVAERQVPWLSAEGVRPENIVRIPNGVPLDGLRARARAAPDRAALGLPPEGRLVLHVARFVPQKRQEWTYEAVRQLREDLGDVHAVFAGDAGESELVERIAAEGSTGWAHVLGTRDDVPALLAHADLAVLPSSAEALPMAMIEAMAIGVPQVATDVGDVAAALRASGAGLVVGVDDHDAFVRACRTALGPGADAMRERALAAAEDFDADRMVARYAEMFEGVVARANGSAA